MSVYVLELTEKQKDNLAEIANEVIDLLTDQRHLSPMECWALLDLLRTSLEKAHGMYRVEKFEVPTTKIQ